MALVAASLTALLTCLAVTAGTNASTTASANDLRHLNDAQDRLIGGGYGLCVFCGDQISEQRLLADPAASMCLDCQRKTEGEMLCRTL